MIIIKVTIYVDYNCWWKSLDTDNFEPTNQLIQCQLLTDIMSARTSKLFFRGVIKCIFSYSEGEK